MLERLKPQRCWLRNLNIEATVMEHIVSLEEKLVGDVTSLKKYVKSPVSLLQNNLGQVVEVVNANIAPKKVHD